MKKKELLMKPEHGKAIPQTNIQLSDFYPLIIIFLLIFSFTIGRRIYFGWSFHAAMADFMGSFFLVFGIFKAINLQGFAQAYATYDIIAKSLLVRLPVSIYRNWIRNLLFYR